MADTELPKYEPDYKPDVVKSAEQRKLQADEIKKAWGYDKKTPEGRLHLSREWIKRAGLDSSMVSAICKEIGINPKQLKATTREEAEKVDQAVQAWQKKYNEGKKEKIDTTGALWWETLEKLENEITTKYETRTKTDVDSWLIEIGKTAFDKQEKAKRNPGSKPYKAYMEKELGKMNNDWSDYTGVDPAGNNLTPYEENWKTVGIQNQNWEIYNKDTGTWESLDKRNARLGEEKATKLSDLQGKLDKGDRAAWEWVEVRDPNGVLLEHDNDKNLWVAAEGDNKGKILNTTDGTYESWDERDKRIAEDKKSKLSDLQGKLDKGDRAAWEWVEVRDPNGVLLEHDNDKNLWVAAEGDNKGKILNTTDGTYESWDERDKRIKDADPEIEGSARYKAELNSMADTALKWDSISDQPTILWSAWENVTQDGKNIVRTSGDTVERWDPKTNGGEWVIH